MLWKTLLSRSKRLAVPDRNSQWKGETLLSQLEPKLPNLMEFVKHPQELYRELSTLGKDLEQDSYSLIKDAQGASSTDHPRQTLDNVLEDNRHTFWSSSGSADSSSHEWICFSLHSVSMIHQVVIQPFRATFQAGIPVYAPLTVTVMVGFNPDVLHTVTPEFTIENEPVPQTLDLSQYLLVGNFIKIQLNGKRQAQHLDDLFYIALQSVQCTGIEVDSVFESPELFQTVTNFCQSLGISLESPSSATPFSQRQTSIRLVKAAFKEMRRMIYQGDFEKCAYTMTLTPDTVFTTGNLQDFQEKALRVATEYYISKGEPADKATEIYLNVMLKEDGRELNEFESLLWVDWLLKRGDFEEVEKALYDPRISLTEDIADRIRPFNVPFAVRIYYDLSIIDKASIFPISFAFLVILVKLLN